MPETHEEARQMQFLAALKSLKLRFPNKVISDKTGYNPGIVSEYINGKKKVSEKFLRSFSEAFGLNFETLEPKPVGMPGDPVNRERAMIRVLWNRWAKFEAEHTGQDLEKVLDSMDADTMIAWRELDKQ